MKILRQSIIVSAVFFILCGVIYPYFMTGVANIFFKEKAQGSIIYIDGKPVGSKLIGQKFEKPEYLHGRPSAYNYNIYDEKPADDVLPASGGTNYGNSNPAYEKDVRNNLAQVLSENPAAAAEDIPSELVTSSGSGLDPHISLQGALLQVDRIAKARGIEKEAVAKVIKENSEKDIVNVLETNIKSVSYTHLTLPTNSLV